jgi:uncharacterized protein (DUF1778 family)
MSNVNRTNARKAESLERQKKALELRRMGLGYIEIGEQIGISKSQAQRLVARAMEESRLQIDESAADLKAEELSRLDGMLRAVWPQARKGSLQAVDRVLKIGERRAKLLGLDAPVKLIGDPENPIQHDHKHVHELTDEDLARIAGGGSS